MLDKSERVKVIAQALAAATNNDDVAVGRAAELAKCDLITGLVGEFPELQGTMGSVLRRGRQRARGRRDSHR